MKPFAVLLLLLPVAAHAVLQSRAELGGVKIPVADRSLDERREALNQGLDRVLVRLTGHQQLSRFESLDPVRSGDPLRWVLQYRYVQQDQSGKKGSGMALRARFDVAALLDRLGSLGVPVWDENRPRVLVWLVVQGLGGGEILTRDGEHHPRLRQIVKRAAERRGLPLVFPRSASIEQGALQPVDIRGHFVQAVQHASRVYDHALVATAVLYTAGSPRLRWRLLDEGRQVTAGNVQASTAGQALTQWVHAMTEHLVDLYAVRGFSEHQVRIRVRNLDHLQAWHSVQSYLSGLAGVRAIQLRHIDGTTATFRMHFAGPIGTLERLIKLHAGLAGCSNEGVLQTSSAPVASGGGLTRPPAAGTGRTARVPTLKFCWQAQP